MQLKPAQLPKAVRELVSAGWLVEAQGKLYRQPGEFKLAVSSGQDWFDLNATADFEGKAVPLPRLLVAADELGESCCPTHERGHQLTRRLVFSHGGTGSGTPAASRSGASAGCPGKACDCG